eukprot:TRINITY_DN1972_c0_g3_i1.p3 TRINITY_DN1972_c0_g3~~TRINITY_DN1972_c0_g3_i1.p3  ORF type:complete len:164 (+),score=0.57 TRINITY_DN1972_c0_g3_i1:119-610(+)
MTDIYINKKLQLQISLGNFKGIFQSYIQIQQRLVQMPSTCPNISNFTGDFIYRKKFFSKFLPLCGNVCVGEYIRIFQYSEGVYISKIKTEQNDSFPNDMLLSNLQVIQYSFFAQEICSGCRSKQISFWLRLNQVIYCLNLVKQQIFAASSFCSFAIFVVFAKN